MNHGKYLGKCDSKYADGGVVGAVKTALGMKSDAQKAADAQIKRDAAKGKDNRNVFERAKAIGERSALAIDAEDNSQSKQE